MKLLFDQNISFRVIKKISALYPEAKQIKDLGLENATDLTNLKGFPPKIIWLRIENTKTESIVNVFNKKHELIIDFIENPDFKDIAYLEIV